jgi:hypothetical protein
LTVQFTSLKQSVEEETSQNNMFDSSNFISSVSEKHGTQSLPRPKIGRARGAQTQSQSAGFTSPLPLLTPQVGVLWKGQGKDPKKLRGWQKRWVSLKDGLLSYGNSKVGFCSLLSSPLLSLALALHSHFSHSPLTRALTPPVPLRFLFLHALLPHVFTDFSSFLLSSSLLRMRSHVSLVLIPFKKSRKFSFLLLEEDVFLC